MTIKIEKGIPLPERGGRKGGLSDAVRSMDIGDSFVLPLAKRNGLAHLAVRLGVKLATRKEGADKVRVWRTA
jgi:hypothetical protein